MNQQIAIGNRFLGEHSPVFFIAELSANHNQDYDTAVKTIEAMKEAGADAIKLQTYTPDTITIDCSNDYFQIRQGTIWDGETLYRLYQKAYTPWEWQPRLKKVAEDLGMLCFSSPFDCSSVDFLEKMDVPAYKIASFEITDIPLIEYVASKKKPVIISTGIARLSDIEEAVEACIRAGNEDVTLLKCTSAYPTPLEDIHLRTIPHLAQIFGTVCGLSDHSLSMGVVLGAIALGAKVVERHVILDRSIGGPDASFSMEPKQFKEMVEETRKLEKALGTVQYTLSEKQNKSREHARSLFVVADIQQGEVFTEQNIRSIRPGFGLHTRYYQEILGKKAAKDMKRGTPLDWGHVQ